jgi:hypothetical protein
LSLTCSISRIVKTTRMKPITSTFKKLKKKTRTRSDQLVGE